MFSLNDLSQETLAKVLGAVKESLAGPPLQKAINVATGLVGLQLEAPAAQLVPFMAEFRQKIPRTTQPGSDAVKFKQITAVVQNAKFSTTETAAANAIATTTVEKTATFKEVGTRGSVTRKAVAHGQGYDDVRARESANTLLLALKLEEQCIIGGNVTALATPAAPTVVVVDTEGTIAAAAGGYDVRIAALTLMASNRVSIDRPAALEADGDAKLAGNGRAGVNQDVASDGWTVHGALTTSAATAGGNDALRITWTPIANAHAYAVFVIAAGGTPKLEAIVTQARVTLTSLAGTGFLSTALTGTSADANIFDGMIPLINSSSAAYKKVISGKLTTVGTQIVELQNAFQALWDSALLDEFMILMGGMDSVQITNLLGAAGGGPTIFVGNNEPGRLDMVQGYHVGWVVNSVTGKRCMVNVLPWMKGGTIIIFPTKIPYPKAEITSPFEIAASYGWEQIDYAKTVSGGPVDEFDVREEAVLKDYFPAGCGLLTDVWFA